MNERFKEKVDNIVIPEQKLDIAVTEAIYQANKHKHKQKQKPRKKYRWVSGLVVAAIIFFGIIGSTFVSPVMANMLSNVPLLGSVLSHYDIGLQQAYENNLVQPIGDSAVDRNVEVTVTDVYYDSARLVIGYAVPLDEENQALAEQSEPEYELQIDGKHLMEAGGNWHREGDVMVGKIETTVDLPDEFDISLTFSEMLNKQGNWQFKFPVVKEQSILVYDINKQITTSDYQFNVDSIRLTPAGASFQMELETPLHKDNDGFSDFSYKITSDSGNQLQLIDYETKIIPLVNFDKQVVKIDALYEPLKDTKTVTIVPVYEDGNTATALDDLAVEVNLSEFHAATEESAPERFGLVEKQLDKQTFFREFMIDEISTKLDIELGEYYKAELTVLDTTFAYEFQKRNKITTSNVVKPLALIEETNDFKQNSENHAFVLYKKENGVNYVLEVARVGETWEEVDSFQMQGKTIDDLEKLYKEAY
ncbi:DUF4179 domain-containing protein [Radiobacillus sp. PE A8.2]|uniref:DUF4179 domain-containing protein n=1 Tax=Radiobacillus sp. PE A8.2 TaxID=3380349 RepID=UPI0038901C4C